MNSPLFDLNRDPQSRFFYARMNAFERRCKSVRRRSNPFFSIQFRFVIPISGIIPKIRRCVDNLTSRFCTPYNTIIINNIATPLNGLPTPSNAIERRSKTLPYMIVIMIMNYNNNPTLLFVFFRIDRNSKSDPDKTDPDRIKTYPIAGSNSTPYF